MSHVFGQCLMFSGNVSCFRAMSHVLGRCLMFSGNVSCFRAMPHVFGQCFMFSGHVTSGSLTIWRLFTRGRLISNVAADEGSWRRTVLERTSSVLQEAARKMKSELNNAMRRVLSYMY